MSETIGKKIRVNEAAKSWVLARPLLSTLMSAFLLSVLWTMIWFFVLLVITYATKTETVATVLVGGLLLSTVAEAFIRVFETSRLASVFALGNRDAPEGDKPVSWAFAWLFFIVLVVVFMGESIELPNETVFRLANSENGGLLGMVPEWIDQFGQSPIMVASLIICLGLRTYIYKKDHKSEKWKSAVSTRKSD